MGAPFAELGPLGLLLVLLIAIRGTEKVRGVLWGKKSERERGRKESVRRIGGSTQMRSWLPPGAGGWMKRRMGLTFEKKSEI